MPLIPILSIQAMWDFSINRTSLPRFDLNDWCFTWFYHLWEDPEGSQLLRIAIEIIYIIYIYNHIYIYICTNDLICALKKLALHFSHHFGELEMFRRGFSFVWGLWLQGVVWQRYARRVLPWHLQQRTFGAQPLAQKSHRVYTYIYIYIHIHRYWLSPWW